MKKLILTSFLVFCMAGVYGQTITLTFSAKDAQTQAWLDLDSVNVINLDASCDTTLFGANPVLELDSVWPVGLAEPAFDNPGSLLLPQNIPNPFHGTTIVRVYMETEGELHLVVNDIRGRALSKYDGMFERGWHRFAISTGGTPMAVLRVSDGLDTRTVKLLNAGSGKGEDRITYLGSSDSDHPITKSFLDREGFIFYLGDPLMYSGYVDGYFTSVLYDNPVCSEDYIFAMIPEDTSATVPTVTTDSVTAITQSTATSGGNVTSDGGAPVTARGVCWSTSPNPTTADDHTIDGSGTGSFVSYVTGLNYFTLYYIRAYATNNVGTAYGNEHTFTTLNAELATVTTDSVTNITTTTATCGGNVLSDGGSPVTEKGVCYSTSPNPTIMDFRVIDGSGTGSFVSQLVDLMWNTQYYIRAYAINGVGTAYGNERSFTTLQATLPVVTTDTVTNITQTTATSGGNVTSDGGLPVTVRGVCWSLSPNPTTADNHTEDGNGTGSFASYLTGLTPDTLYYVRAYATNVIGTAYGNERSFITLEMTIPTVTTATVTNITMTTATSGGNVTYDGGSYVTARGVCWSLTPNPTTAGNHTTDGTGTGGFVSYLTGLTPDTGYYIRAYATNNIGTAYGNELTFNTLGQFFCGDSFVVYHVVGNVVPVSKTTTYGTVDDIPGEPTKCWITNNLGSDHQADSVNDPTEPSAGWYWQFNRQQGYKHDGINRIPNTQWISSINENSNWLASNDPCILELADGWRLPTNTEWNNVNTAGGWTNWNGPWNSALKLHASGSLDYNNGNLGFRGSEGSYWSSMQYPPYYHQAWSLAFYIGSSSVTFNLKSSGFTIRCIRD